MQFKNGSLQLARIFGINVYLHWSWALVAVIQVYRMKGGSTYPFWFFALQYLALFLIVLTHEFGHALACKSVGGKAERIVLWPFGGIAFVDPPPRPGALLWSIAAGPLVNVVLVPVTIVPLLILKHLGITGAPTDFAIEVAVINLSLLIFNILPFYPLDGGQIFRAIAWYIFGQWRSLIIASAVGMVGAVLLAIGGMLIGEGIWLTLIAIFLGMQALASFKMARVMNRMMSGPRHLQARCPSCGEHPPIGPFWRCSCGKPVDTFASGGKCPNCGRDFQTTMCPRCGKASPRYLWEPVAADVASGENSPFSSNPS